MKEELIQRIVEAMDGSLCEEQLKRLRDAVQAALVGYTVGRVLTDTERQREDNEQLINVFLSAKKVEGCSEKTLDYYRATLKKMLTGELNIGVTYSFRTIMMDTMIDFLKAYPGVKLNIIYRSMEELMLMLKSRQLDFVLAFSPLKFDSEIDSRVIFSNRVAAVVKDGHPLSQQQSARLEDLERYDLVLPARGLQARNAFDKLVDRKDLHLRVKVEVNNVDIIFKLLHRSNYVAVLSESTVLHEDGCVSIPIDVPDNRMEGCIHVLKDAYIKNSAQEFIRMLCQSTSILMNFALKDIL